MKCYHIFAKFDYTGVFVFAKGIAEAVEIYAANYPTHSIREIKLMGDALGGNK